MMVNELETNVRCSSVNSEAANPHLINLIGLYEDSRDTLFVVFEENVHSLKQVILDSRALIHYPVFASKNQRFSTLTENQVLQYLIDVADGMEYLSNLNVSNSLTLGKFVNAKSYLNFFTVLTSKQEIDEFISFHFRLFIRNCVPVMYLCVENTLKLEGSG